MDLGVGVADTLGESDQFDCTESNVPCLGSGLVLVPVLELVWVLDRCPFVVGREIILSLLEGPSCFLVLALVPEILWFPMRERWGKKG